MKSMIVAMLLVALAFTAVVDAHDSQTRDIPAGLVAAKTRSVPAHVGSRTPPIISGTFRKIIDVTPMVNMSAPGDVTTDLHPTYMLETKTETVEKNYFEKKSFVFAGGMGFHIDTPAHLYGSTVRTIDEIRPEELIGPLVLIDKTSVVTNNPDYQLSVQDIQQWERSHGRIKDGSFVVMKTGWSSRYYNEALYRNADAQGVQHYPGFSGLAATWLIENRNINGIGVDTISIDAGTNFYYNAHYTILGNNRIGIENMDLSDPRLPASGAYLIVSPPKVQDAPEMLARGLVLAP
jgi:kynurenine formamidase